MDDETGLPSSQYTDIGTCRFYENEYPAVDEMVVVRVHQIADVAAYVHLLEYNNFDGMILFTELSRKLIRAISQYIRVGKIEYVQVIRVDPQQGYIDLSKKKVSDEDIAACEDRYNKAKAVHSIMRNIAVHCRMQLEDVYKMIAWPLNRSFGNAFDAFRKAVSDPDSIFGPLSLPPDMTDFLVREIQLRMKPQPVRIRADLEVTCFQSDGIEAIRYALLQGAAVSTEEIPLKVKLVAPPKYVVLCTSLDREGGLALVDQAISKITEAITSRGGEIAVIQKTRVVSESDDRKMQQELEEAESDLIIASRGDQSDDEDDDPRASSSGRYDSD